MKGLDHHPETWPSSYSRSDRKNDRGNSSVSYESNYIRGMLGLNKHAFLSD